MLFQIKRHDDWTRDATEEEGGEGDDGAARADLKDPEKRHTLAKKKSGKHFWNFSWQKWN